MNTNEVCGYCYPLISLEKNTDAEKGLELINENMTEAMRQIKMYESSTEEITPHNLSFS